MQVEFSAQWSVLESQYNAGTQHVRSGSYITAVTRIYAGTHYNEYTLIMLCV